MKREAVERWDRRWMTRYTIIFASRECRRSYDENF